MCALGELVATVAEHGARLDNLETWQKKQNGTLCRVEGKIDRLVLWMLTAAVGTVGTLIVGLILLLLRR